MKFHRTFTDGRWATTPRLAVDLENDDALDDGPGCDCETCDPNRTQAWAEIEAACDHAWPDELLPETNCDRCGLRYCDWTETP